MSIQNDLGPSEYLMDRKKSYEVGKSTRAINSTLIANRGRALSPYAEFERAIVSRTDTKNSIEREKVVVKEPKLKSELRNARIIAREVPQAKHTQEVEN